MIDALDAYVARFQSMPGVNLHSLTGDGNGTTPWFEVSMQSVVADLVVNELTVPAQLAVIAAEIQKWGRFSALAKRVWEVEERGYRAWRSAFMLAASNPEGKAKEWKKPSGETIEAMYRVAPEYHTWQTRVERAEEAYNTVEAILLGFRAKKDVLLSSIRKYHEAGVS